MPTTSSFAAVDNYLGRLPTGPRPHAAIWRAQDGSVQGQFFACTLTSAFDAIHRIDGAVAGSKVVAFEGRACGVSPEDQGLSVWRLLNQAASDDESIELDRLCRLLHTINYFRQPIAADGADLYLSIHNRLLAAVSSNHGHAFLRILNALELPLAQIVLQLPAIGPGSRWLANYVADNYQRNGFRLAFGAATVVDAIDVVRQFRPHAIRIDARTARDPETLAPLLTLTLARDAGVDVIVTHVETHALLAFLGQVCRDIGGVVHAQGRALDAPRRERTPGRLQLA
ncbi:MAG: EAL domain-containing protein [Pseudomonadota bacterium]|nr:EAL domain-containing protein [Pseudomonadota bacterium]